MIFLLDLFREKIIIGSNLGGNMASIPTENVQLLFREQWWGANCFTTLIGKELEEKTHLLGKIAQEQLQSLNESDLNTKYIPNELDRKSIVNIAHSLRIESSWQVVLANADALVDKVTYHNLGYILFRIRLSKNAQVTQEKVRPAYLQQIIMLVWNKLTKDNSQVFKFDELTPPYVFSVCSGYLPSSPKIEWTNDAINLNKRELGQWAELYSGQFADYRDDIYQRRVENDLSNRTSEIHLINRNSALIYMEPENYDAYFIKDEETPNSTNYMHGSMVNPVNKIRTIAFAMIALNSQLDSNMKNLVDKEYIKKPLKQIKNDLETTTRLKNMLQILLAPFFTDISRSNRQHYTSILSRAVALNDIEAVWGRISQKIEASSHELSTIYDEKQEETTKKQEKALGMVNLILSAGIVFDIVGYIITNDAAGAEIKQIIGVIMGVFLVILLITYFKNRSKV